MIQVRKATENDKPLLNEWLYGDAVHQSLGIKIGDFFAKDTELVLICDSDGTPLMAARLHLALRAAFQFNPKTPHKTAKVIREVRDWLQTKARDWVVGKTEPTEIIVRPAEKAARMVEKIGFRPFEGKVLRCE
jgi:hypothetical protein